ncbi:MAG: cytochrome d ubiquinol oxidase subunit II [Lactobacillus iners]|nr:cytochrome d ubiquinol oxidase subunit II [Lactobacillus iners]
MSVLQILWFILIGVLFSGFFFLDGFDYGVGMAVKTLAHNDEERGQVIQTIGPVWDGNEVWLITAGGAMFASFPYWYASLFSGYYLILLLILVGLIIRGVSFEFRAQSSQPNKRIWDNAWALGSFIAPFFLGVMFVSMIKGMPIDAKGNMSASFFDYFNWFSVVGGIALTLLTYLHGLNYIVLRTKGVICDRARNYAQALYWVLYAGEVVFALLLLFQTDFIKVHPILTLICLVLIVAFSVAGHVSVFSNSSSNYTLTVMTIATFIFVPIVLAYTIWSYWIFRKRIEMPAVGEGY